MRRRSGAWLAVRALEQLGIRYTFGIPGVHNTELYDELARSEAITPILVTHEGGGAFMADGVSRTSDSVGCLVIVPAAGLTHAMSGIGEAYLDGIPMLVLSGGIRRDTGRSYQLHELDQQKVADGITKAAFLVAAHDSVMPTIFEAFEIATSGEPGPVLVEIPADVLMFAEAVAESPRHSPPASPRPPDPAAVVRAAELLAGASKPGMYVGWGARSAVPQLQEAAEQLAAPVATTLQGLSAFPADHPLHVGMGFGNSAVPAARAAFARCDCLLAVGVRFAELATGSYGMEVPANLIHIDINSAVFNCNYEAAVAIEADAAAALDAFLEALQETLPAARDSGELRRLIRSEKESFAAAWTAKPSSDRVSPGIFFGALREALDRDAFLVVDDGNHTFLAAEQFPVYAPGRFISPTDFNCMGYCVPATIGVKLANPDAQVVAVVGDGGFLMTGLEILTAATLKVGAIFFVFHDGELAQISQLQQLPFNRKTCTVLGELNVEGVATATGAAFVRLATDADVVAAITSALEIAATGRPVVVDANIDYRRKSAFTEGVVRTNLGRFTMRQKLRMVTRAVLRHTLG
ncbi:MAG TPA: thiamine pyrophosphate-binding protein [Acidobacteriota bacterium]|nr:thiamine pyrophosphate-binding protein [Acidobacteriota bacterium]